MKRSLLIGYILFFFVSSISIALEINGKALKNKVDLEGSKDHPMVSRLPGSWIVQYEVKEFDQMIIPMGKALKVDKFENVEETEGRVTRVGYALPAGRSSFEALRQYDAALQKAGFVRMASCERQNCGFPFSNALETLPGEHGDFYWYDLERNTLYYSAWKLKRPEGNVYVMLVTFAPNEIRRVENSFALVRINETKSMEEGLVKVDAAAMQKGIAAEGHIAIYGIEFDFDKAEIRPESKPTLQEIANLMTQNPKWNLYVVGHTDNVGTYKYNLDLSERRADAVVKALTTEFGVPGGRLNSTGIGSIAPVASNDTEEGRTKNRRVELVKQ